MYNALGCLFSSLILCLHQYSGNCLCCSCKQCLIHSWLLILPSCGDIGGNSNGDEHRTKARLCSSTPTHFILLHKFMSLFSVLQMRGNRHSIEGLPRWQAAYKQQNCTSWTHYKVYMLKSMIELYKTVVTLIYIFQTISRWSLSSKMSIILFIFLKKMLWGFS